VEIIGSVAPEEVPRVPGSRREGLWATVVRRAVEDHEQGRVTVIKMDSQADVDRLRNGVRIYLREAGYKLHPVTVDQGKDGVRVFLELRRKPEQESTG